MGVALKVYEQLTEAKDDRERAKIIADAFEALEARYPADIATQGHVRESELRLQKEIKEVEGRLQKEIESVRLEIKQTEGQLRKEMQEIEGGLRKDIESVRLEIREVEVRLVRVLHRQTFWIIGAVGAIVALLRLLDAWPP
jgi:hypothetical protein